MHWQKIWPASRQENGFFKVWADGLRSCSDLVSVARCPGTKMDVVYARQYPELTAQTSAHGWARCPSQLPLELVPVPGHDAQISARAPTKGYVQQAGACAREPSLNRA